MKRSLEPSWRLSGRYCWLARQYRKGWRVGFVMGDGKPHYLSIWFPSEQDVAKALKANCVYVHARSGG